MAKSLSQIESQIQKLQKEADAIRATVIARIRKEMAQHGLTAEDLFAEARGTFVGNGRRTKGKAAATKAPKYADGAGNTWGGMGKRPGWIREAVEAGRALEEFLVGAIAKPAKEAKAAKPAGKKAAAVKKDSLARKPAAKKATRATVAKKYAAPKKAATKRPARKKASPSAEAPAAYSTRSRTPFRCDGGQHSAVMADTVPR